MAQQTINNGDSGLDARTKINDNFSEVYSSVASKQPLDTQLTSLAGLSFSGNALKVVRVDAGENSFELVTLSTGLTHSQVLSLISIRF